MFYVVELTPASIPRASGFWKYGVMKVLSQIEISERLRAISATRARSMSFIIGLVGVSSHTAFVRGVIEDSRTVGFERSTKENERPCFLKTLSKSRKVQIGRASCR